MDKANPAVRRYIAQRAELLGAVRLPNNAFKANAGTEVNRQLRKVTKTRSVFPTDDSLFKMLYLAMVDITKKWTGRQRDWSMIHAQLSIYFAERMPE